MASTIGSRRHGAAAQRLAAGAPLGLGYRVGTRHCEVLDEVDRVAYFAPTTKTDAAKRVPTGVAMNRVSTYITYLLSNTYTPTSVTSDCWAVLLVQPQPFAALH